MESIVRSFIASVAFREMCPPPFDRVSLYQCSSTLECLERKVIGQLPFAVGEGRE
jgi:hypothetical protein